MLADGSESEPDLPLVEGVRDKPPPRNGIERELESLKGAPDHAPPKIIPQLPGFSWRTWRITSGGKGESAKAVDEAVTWSNEWGWRME